jgi:hypothetical protein
MGGGYRSAASPSSGNHADGALVRRVRMFRLTQTLAIALGCLCLGRSPAFGQTVVSADTGLVRVSASAVPVRDLLADFNRVAPLIVFWQTGTANAPVTTTIDQLPPVVALRQILLAAGVNFVIAGGTPGVPIRVAIGDFHGSPFGVPAAPSQRVSQFQVDGVDTADASTSASEPAADVAQDRSPEHLAALLARPAGQSKPALGAPLTLPFPGPEGVPITVPNLPPPPGIGPLPLPNVAPFPRSPQPGRVPQPAADSSGDHTPSTVTPSAVDQK